MENRNNKQDKGNNRLANKKKEKRKIWDEIDDGLSVATDVREMGSINWKICQKTEKCGKSNKNY